MKKLICLVLFLAISSTPLFANVFVFDINVGTSSGRKISYRLNEDATSVQIEIFGPLPATTIIDTFNGTTAKGLNIVEWLGAGSVSGETYGFKITASNTPGFAEWTKISDDSRLFQLYNPRTGVSVNKNKLSPYFGMIYTGETTGNVTTVSGRLVTNRGLFALYPDGSDPLGLGDTPRSGGVAWEGSNSPYHVFVAPDDRVYICGWSDAFCGVWRAEPDLSGSFTQLLDETNDTDGVAKGIHGSVAGVWVEGIGESTVLYTYDEDLLPPGVTGDPGLRNIFKLAIGNGPFPWTSPAEIQIDERDFASHHLYGAGGIFINDTNGGVKRDSAGNWYVSNYRAVKDCPCLMKISPDGKTMLWDSIMDGTNDASEEFMYNMGGFDIDEANNRVAVAINSLGFKVFPLDPLPVGDLAAQITTVNFTPVGTNNRGICFDAAGNVYLVNNSSELLYIYSPPGPNSFTSETTKTLPGGVPLAAQSKWALYE